MGAILLTGAHGEPNTPRAPLHLFRREDIRGAAHGAEEKAAVSATLARVPEGLCRDHTGRAPRSSRQNDGRIDGVDCHGVRWKLAGRGRHDLELPRAPPSVLFESP